MLLLWKLNLLRSNAILLLEEPETYISPIAQQSLMDVLVYHTVQKKISFIITSHSPKMVKGLDPKSLKFFVSSQGGSRVIYDVPQRELLRSIGLEAPKRFLLLVEDRAAREILSSLLSRFARTTLQESEILSLGGASDIEYALKLLPRATTQIRVVGIFDGDMKSKIKTEPGRWSSTALPFERPSEEEFRALLSGRHILVADAFGVSEQELLVVHSSLVGKDMHDWLEEFARGLGRSYESTIEMLMKVWLTITENTNGAKEFCDQLEELLRA